MKTILTNSTHDQLLARARFAMLERGLGSRMEREIDPTASVDDQCSQALEFVRVNAGQWLVDRLQVEACSDTE
jgi:hypothetical protein